MEMTSTHLRDILASLREHHGDTTSIEVKGAADGFPEGMGATICAFANMPGGGVAIFGVSESEAFVATGVYDAAQCEAAFAAVARDWVSPAPQVETRTFNVDGEQVVVGTVHGLSLADRPAMYKGEAYLRQADGDYRMGPHELRMVEIAKLRVDEEAKYDALPVDGASRLDLDEGLTEQFVQNFRAARKLRGSRRTLPEDVDGILRLSGALTVDAVPTVAGLYAMGTFPQAMMPTLHADAAVNLPRGEMGRQVQSLEVFEGPLVDQYSAMLDWVRENLPVVRRYRSDGNMAIDTEIPMSAVREVIANALVHRDLSPATLNVGEFIHLRLTQDRLIVSNPGGLRGLSLEQVQSVAHAQIAVNPRLYGIVQNQRTGSGDPIIEGGGGGIREVFEACRAAGLPRPVLIDKGVAFIAILFRGIRDDHGAEINVEVVKNLDWDNRAGTMTTHHSEKNIEGNTEQHVQLSTVVPKGHKGEMKANNTRTIATVPALGFTNQIPLSQQFAMVTANGPAIAQVLAPGVVYSLDEIARRTGLTRTQARYALRALRGKGLVVLEGGQGRRVSGYRLA